MKIHLYSNGFADNNHNKSPLFFLVPQVLHSHNADDDYWTLYFLLSKGQHEEDLYVLYCFFSYQAHKYQHN